MLHLLILEYLLGKLLNFVSGLLYFLVASGLLLYLLSQLADLLHEIHTGLSQLLFHLLVLALLLILACSLSLVLLAHICHLLAAVTSGRLSPGLAIYTVHRQSLHRSPPLRPPCMTPMIAGANCDKLRGKMCH